MTLFNPIPLLLFATLTCYSQTGEGTANPITVKIDFPRSFIISKDLYGANQPWTGASFLPTHPAHIETCKDLGWPCLRYPGGTVSNYYDFETGYCTGYPGIPDDVYQDRVVSVSEDIEKSGKAPFGGVNYMYFAQFIRENDVAFSLSLNIIGKSADDNRRFMDSLKTLGAEPQYIELGNEVFFPSYEPAIADVFEYISICKENIQAIRSVFPDIKIGVVIPSPVYTVKSFLDDAEMGRTDKLTRMINWYIEIQKENFYDAVILHMYSDIGMDADVAAENILPYTEAYKYACSHADGKSREVLEEVKETFPGKEIWVTEYHVGGGSSGNLKNYRLRRSYLGGLFAADFLLKLYSTEGITLGSWHNFMMWLTYPQKNNTSTLIPPDQKFGYEVNYYFFRMFRDPVNSSSRFAPVSFSGLRNYEGTGEYADVYSDVDGGFFFSDSTGYLLLINKHETAYEIDGYQILSVLGDSTEAGIQDFLRLSPSSGLDLAEALESETAYSLAAATDQSGKYTVQPYSVSVIKFSYQKIKAAYPDPYDGQQCFTDSLILYWLPGFQSNSSEIYFGTSPEEVLNANHDSSGFKGSLSGNVYYPGKLISGQTYYWRIDAVGEHSTVKGPVWCFKMEKDTTPKIFSVKLIFTDRSKGTFIYRAFFTHDDNIVLTNRDGEIALEYLIPDTLHFSVEHNEYFTEEGSVIIKADTILVIPLTAKYANLFFNLTDNSGPIANVKVSLSGISPQSTSETGSAMFFNRKARTTYVYHIEKEGYPSFSDSVYLEIDTTLHINLQTVSSFFPDSPFTRVYPNPVKDCLYIDAGREDAKICLLNPTGHIVMTEILYPGNNRMDLTGLSPGFYIIRIQSGEKIHLGKIIKL